MYQEIYSSLKENAMKSTFKVCIVLGSMVFIISGFIRCGNKVKVPEKDTIPPTISMEVYQWQLSFPHDLSSGGNDVEFFIAQDIKKINFSGTAKDQGGIKKFEIKVEGGAHFDNGNYSTIKEYDNNNAIDAVTILDGVNIPTNSHFVRIYAEAEDFHNNKTTTPIALARKAMCNELNLTQKVGSSSGIDYFYKDVNIGSNSLVTVYNLENSEMTIHFIPAGQRLGNAGVRTDKIPANSHSTYFEKVNGSGRWAVDWKPGMTSAKIKVCEYILTN